MIGPALWVVASSDPNAEQVLGAMDRVTEVAPFVGVLFGELTEGVGGIAERVGNDALLIRQSVVARDFRLIHAALLARQRILHNPTACCRSVIHRRGSGRNGNVAFDLEGRAVRERRFEFGGEFSFVTTPVPDAALYPRREQRSALRTAG